jgi:hypothetical protein
MTIYFCLLILLGDTKMIHYSPMSRYTAQRIADKVGNGAYFYSHFSVEAENHLFYPSKIDPKTDAAISFGSHCSSTYLSFE